MDLTAFNRLTKSSRKEAPAKARRNSTCLEVLSEALATTEQARQQIKHATELMQQAQAERSSSLEAEQIQTMADLSDDEEQGSAGAGHDAHGALEEHDGPGEQQDSAQDRALQIVMEQAAKKHALQEKGRLKAHNYCGAADPSATSSSMGGFSNLWINTGTTSPRQGTTTARGPAHPEASELAVHRSAKSHGSHASSPMAKHLHGASIPTSPTTSGRLREMSSVGCGSADGMGPGSHTATSVFAHTTAASLEAVHGSNSGPLPRRDARRSSHTMLPGVASIEGSIASSHGGKGMSEPLFMLQPMQPTVLLHSEPLLRSHVPQPLIPTSPKPPGRLSVDTAPAGSSIDSPGGTSSPTARRARRRSSIALVDEALMVAASLIVPCDSLGMPIQESGSAKTPSTMPRKAISPSQACTDPTPVRVQFGRRAKATLN